MAQFFSTLFGAVLVLIILMWAFDGDYYEKCFNAPGASYYSCVATRVAGIHINTDMNNTK